MTAVAKYRRTTYPRRGEATFNTDSKPKSPVLQEKNSRQILYQFVAGKRRNKTPSEINLYSKRDGSKAAETRQRARKLQKRPRKQQEKFWFRRLQT